jgi:hypothetical protein
MEIIILTKSYRSALEHAVSLAPQMNKPTEFIRWAEDICSLLAFVYVRDYEDITEELLEACREEQGFDEIY